MKGNSNVVLLHAMKAYGGGRNTEPLLLNLIYSGQIFSPAALPTPQEDGSA